MDLRLRHTSPLYPPHPRAKPIRYLTFDLAFGPSRPRQSTRSVCRSVADRTERGERRNRAPLFLHSSDPFSLHQIGRDFAAPPSSAHRPSPRPVARELVHHARLPFAILDITEHCEHQAEGGRREGRRDLSTPKDADSAALKGKRARQR